MLGKRLLFGLVIILNLYLLLNLVWGGGGLLAYLDLKERHQALEAELAQLEHTSLGLSREIRSLTADPQHQRQVVRERMNYVGDDEVLYVFPAAAAPTANEAGDEEEN